MSSILIEGDSIITIMSILMMEANQIRVESDSDSTFYHILTRIQIQVRIFLNMNAEQNLSDSDIYSIHKIIFSYFLYELF
jgi:hypothetical protein